MDTTNPVWYFLCLLVLKLLWSSALSHAGRVGFASHFSKWALKVQMAFEDSELGRTHPFPRHRFNNWFLSNAIVHHASCIHMSVNLCE